jgi:hypothetical protein
VNRKAGLAVVITLVLGVAAAWLIWDRDDDRPEIYDITGSQPGDMKPNLAVDDNVRHYGLDMDLPYHFKTNKLGFRGPDPDANGSPTILLMGDSFVFGMGVDEGETVADGVRRTLRASAPGSVVHSAVVHNAGVPGYTIADHLGQWRQKLHKLRPDVVLLFHTASDLKEMERPGSMRTALGDDAIDRDGYVFTQKQLLERLGASARVKLLKRRGEYGRQVVALAQEVTRAGGRFALVLWVDDYGMAQLRAGPMAEEVRAAGVPVFDGNRKLRQQGEVPFDQLFLPDSHFSAAGNDLAGRQTTEWMLETGLLAKPIAPTPTLPDEFAGRMRVVALQQVSNASGLELIERNGELLAATADEVDEWEGPGDPPPLIVLSRLTDGAMVDGVGKAGSVGEIEALAERNGQPAFPFKTDGQAISIRVGEQSTPVIGPSIIARLESEARKLAQPPCWFEFEGLARAPLGWAFVVSVVRPNVRDTPRSTLANFLLHVGDDGALQSLTPPITKADGSLYTDYGASLDLLPDGRAVIGGFFEAGAVVVSSDGRVQKRIDLPTRRVEGIVWHEPSRTLYLVRECPGQGTDCAGGNPFGTPLWIAPLPDGL